MRENGGTPKSPLADFALGELIQGAWKRERVGLGGREIGGILSTFGLSETVGPFPVVAAICADNQQGRVFGLLSHSKKKVETLFMAIRRCTERLGNTRPGNIPIKDLCSAE